MSKIVTFEQAKRLKELGYEYDIHQVYFIHNNSKDITRQAVSVEEIFLDEFKDNYSPIPAIASALDWIREEKSNIIVFEVCVTTFHNLIRYMYRIYGFHHQLGTYEQVSHGIDYDTHPLAESALLDAVLTYLEVSKASSCF